MPDEAIQVAVRVRPFNDREKARKAVNVIEMSGKKTGIRDPANMKAEPKWFTYDYSYWSHDQFRDNNGYLEPTSSKYADQMTVFNDLGRGVLENAWKGYNCSLFAYGQTGSGKSYSMVGYGPNKGIVPIACEELFKQIEAKRSEGLGVEYQVTVSMLEIYCEKVRDLLDNKAPPKGGLKIREHPKKGFYVENLRAAPVNNYKAIEARIDEGTRNRTVAATSMNATSSRAHTIVQIHFIQKGNETTKSSIINLVDLAGSERHSETGSEGDRLKEGIVINQSLSTLGRCIKADRAKSIKTKAIVNESATDRLIRELREENQKLLAQLKTGVGGGVGSAGGPNDELETLRQQLEANKHEMEQMEQTWQSRLAQEGARTQNQSEEQAMQAEQRKTIPHFWNLNEDPALTNMVVHFVNKGDSRIGNSKAHPPADIQLNGLSVQKDHAKLRNSDNKKVLLIPLPGARILVNGNEISRETELFHNDRILFGGNHLYVFAHPIGTIHKLHMEKKKKSGEKLETITYDIAQQEIAESSGIMGMTKAGAAKSKEDMILEEELIHLLPQVYQANAMSDELKKDMKFEIVLVAPQARGLKSGHTETFVKAVNKSNDTEFMWDKNKFTNRYYGMQELYQNYIEGYQDWDVPKERDPFYEPVHSEVLLGAVHVYLQSLAYMVEQESQLPITDFKGAERGQLNVSLVPCTPQGKEMVGEFVDSPEDMVGLKGHPRRRSIFAYNAAASSDYKAKADRLEAKLNKIQRIIDDALNNDSKHVSVKDVQKALKHEDSTATTVMNGEAGEDEAVEKPKKRGSSKRRTGDTKSAGSSAKGQKERKRRSSRSKNR